jgi:hypothetical protein
MLKAQNNIQAALDKVSELCGENGFKLYQEKTKTMHINRLRLRSENQSDSTIRFNEQTLEGADQSTLIRVHKLLKGHN